MTYVFIDLHYSQVSNLGPSLFHEQKMLG